MTTPAEAVGPAWWPLLRRVIIFFLGCAVIIDALDVTGTGRNIGEMIVGLVMIGLLPLDDLVGAIDRVRRPRRREE